ncbi:MAG: FtsX-like permease family protein, partial [Clostridia bacterium]|nr:FtsX-like permease family protein [Clostridia bacterium]
KPTQLSGGQKHRVAIARALINNPDIILADEPTGALDSSTTSQIIEILKEIADDGKLVIMVTHSEKVAKISSRVVEIADGEIIKDEKNLNYQKNQKQEKIILEENNLNLQESKKKKKEGHLSFWSAFRLSIHNMWAGKTKNVLMAVGVSIALVSMILMLSFGSGLTNYISDMSKDYSRPDIVTISHTKDTFSNEDISSLTDEINTYLDEEGNSFKIIPEGENKNLTYGLMHPPTKALVCLKYTQASGDVKSESAMVTYTTPPYYDEKNFASSNGKICGKDEIMVSSTILKLLEVEDPNDAVGKQLKLSITYGEMPPIPRDVTISAIIDNPLMTILYVDYDYLNQCVIDRQIEDELEPTGISPTSLYITTDGENTTNLINNYIKKNKPELAGSVEEQLAGMFADMMDTFSIALAVISGISLFVALIMILVVLYMSVAERTREIGVLKSIGARKKDIRLIFSSESFLVGLFSGIVSCILAATMGGLFTILFNALLGFAPISMEIQYFAIAILISVIISVLAGLYPSSKAAKLDPVESLRHE